MGLSLEQLRVTGKRLIVDKPEPTSGGERKVGDGVLYAPALSDSHRRWFGQIATVLAVAPDLDPAIKVGTKVIIGEFAGVPVFDPDAEATLYIVGEGEVMAVVV